MNEPERIVLKPPDHACERCGYSKPRKVLVQLSELLLCEACLERVEQQQAWSFLPRPIGCDMDMRHDNSLLSNPAYQARITEEETTLRWLITRQPRSRELSYYLIFLLTVNERYPSAIEECRRVLETYPGDIIADMWRELIHLRWRRSPRRRVSGNQLRRDRRWRRILRHAN